MGSMSREPSFDRTLVTGGTGFIGQHLLHQLVSKGHSPVAIARRMSHVHSLPNVLKERVHWVELDLTNRDGVESVISTEKPSVLFHLAGTRGVNDPNRNAHQTCSDLNVDATLHLLEVANHHEAERIVITGSAEEYGNQSGPFNESTELLPISAYGMSKAEATRLALALYELKNCPVVIARLFTVYGPQQPAGMFASDAIRAAVNAESFLMSEGTQKRDLVFIDDIIAALIGCARTPDIEGKVINFGSGQPVRLCDLAQKIWKISESKGSLVIGKRPRREDDMDVTWSDSSLARDLLGWQPHVDLENGLRATIEWARALESRSQSKLAVS